MRRILLPVGEFGILILGLVLSSWLGAGLGGGVAELMPHLGDGGMLSLFSCGFALGLYSTVWAFVVRRRTTRPWKIDYAADLWELERAERQQHPTRARFKRIAKRVLIGVPTLIAALVFFAFPVMTHLRHPSSHYLRHYRVPVPWTMAVTPIPGVLPPATPYLVLASRGSRFWNPSQISAQIVFGSIDPNADFQLSQRLADRLRAGAREQLRRDFQLGGVAFTCWQYRNPRRHFAREWWNIDCQTPAEVRQWNLYVQFFGREEVIPAFYRMIAGLTPVP